MEEMQEELEQAYIDGFKDGAAGYLIFCSQFEDCEGCPISAKVPEDMDCDEYIVDNIEETAQIIYEYLAEDD